MSWQRARQEVIYNVVLYGEEFNMTGYADPAHEHN